MRILALALATASLCTAQDKQAEVDRIFAGFNTHTPGCAVGVAHNGVPILQSGYGMADLERNVPITPDTVFESGSLAKQFTGMSLLLLAQQGKISLDDPLRKYLPELPDYGAPVTIRHVLSHVSGLREWRPIATFGGLKEGSYVYTNRDLLQMAARQHALNFDPGTHYSYTNTGFNISTILIERALANGTSFETFTHDAIFAPLAMTHTRWRANFRDVVPNRALAYGLSEQKVLQQETPIENIIGAGGLLTTVGDLLLWNENFKHAKVGGPDVVKTQQAPAQLKGGGAITYAVGLIVTTTDGIREVSHSGSTGGYRTWLGRYPDQDISVAVLCNSAEAVPTNLGRKTAALWTGAKPTPISTTYQADPEKLKALAGQYRKLRDNTVTELHWNDGKLTLGNAALTPIGPNEFQATGNRHIQLEGARLKVTTPDDEIIYEPAPHVEPTPAQLATLTGKYESRETASTLLVATDKSGALTLQIADNPPIALRPTFPDAFMMPTGSSIFFIRGASGKVTALSAGEDRVWDLRFTKTY